MLLRQTSRLMQFHSVRTSLFASAHLAPPLAVHWAMRLFATPYGPRRIRYDFSKYPGFHEITLPFNGGHLRGYVWGRVDDRPVVALLHGWGGWGLQMGAFVQPLLDAGFAVAAFDLPAHGQSSGKQANLPLWAAALATITQHFAHLYGVIGHSLGGAALAQALTQGVSIPRAVMISAPADMQDELQRFGRVMRLPQRIMQAVQHGWERKLGIDFNSLRAEAVSVPEQVRVMLVHDRDDPLVRFSEMERYRTRLPNAATLATHGLGHQDILRDEKTINQVICFLRGFAIAQAAPVH